MLNCITIGRVLSWHVYCGNYWKRLAATTASQKVIFSQKANFFGKEVSSDYQIDLSQLVWVCEEAVLSK